MMERAIVMEENSEQNLHIWPNLIAFFGINSSGRFLWDVWDKRTLIIDLVSYTAYVVCVNFIHQWRDLQF